MLPATSATATTPKMILPYFFDDFWLVASCTFCRVSAMMNMV